MDKKVPKWTKSDCNGHDYMVSLRGMDEQPKPSLPSPKAVGMRVSEVFRPASPIDALALFTGRVAQYRRLVDTILETGRHAIVYGERAVGKTSLVSIIQPLIEYLNLDRFVIRENCGTKDTFSDLWTKTFAGSKFRETTQHQIMFETKESTELLSLADVVPLAPDPSPLEVRKSLEQIPASVFIFDEFDCLHRNERRAFTDLIKMMSDHCLASTIILVGVSDTVQDLVADHKSISRAIAQVQVPRMRASEIREILERGETTLGIQFSEDAKSRIVSMAQGLPHYAHLLGKHSVRHATEIDRLQVRVSDVIAAEKSAISEVDEAVRSTYHKATHSAHADAIYKHVLLACALADKDEIGFFRPSAVVEPLSRIRGTTVKFEGFKRHLAEFMRKARGAVLQRIGERRQFRFRFNDPLLPPYVILKGLETGMFSEEWWREIATKDRPKLTYPAVATSQLSDGDLN